MEHFYQDIPGFFDFAGFYKEAVEQAPDGAKFVEVGAFLGKSTAFLAVEIVNSGKKIELHVVDTWAPAASDATCTLYGNLFERFCAKIDRPEFKGIVNIHRMYSHQAARRFEDGSLDLVWLDGDHSYRAVRLDIDSWHRKLKKPGALRAGGVLAGHDYYELGVRQAVDERFENVEQRLEGLIPCWVVR